MGRGGAGREIRLLEKKRWVSTAHMNAVPQKKNPFFFFLTQRVPVVPDDKLSLTAYSIFKSYITEMRPQRLVLSSLGQLVSACRDLPYINHSQKILRLQLASRIQSYNQFRALSLCLGPTCKVAVSLLNQ